MWPLISHCTSYSFLHQFLKELLEKPENSFYFLSSADCHLYYYCDLIFFTTSWKICTQDYCILLVEWSAKRLQHVYYIIVKEFLDIGRTLWMERKSACLKSGVDCPLCAILSKVLYLYFCLACDYAHNHRLYTCWTFLSFDITFFIFLNSLCCHREGNDFLNLCHM